MQSLKILVIEDDFVAQAMMTMLLKAEGYEVVIADCGLKALDLASSEYHVIFIDIGLPDITGIEVGEKLIAQFSHLADKEQPILIALTANTDTSMKEACAAIGLHGFIDKPFDVGKMKIILDKIKR